jgi:hypothetical protein
MARLSLMAGDREKDMVPPWAGQTARVANGAGYGLKPGRSGGV